jgi:diguanylate cyclase (GGDEF)-like protein
MPIGEIEKLQREIARLKELVITDELTRVLNRRGLNQALTPLVKEVSYQLQNPEKRKNMVIRAFTLVFADIDHFKQVNDTYGHAAGDAALRTLAKVLRQNVRGIDVVGRYGGEELIIGLLGASEDDGVRISEDLRKKVEDTQIKVGVKTFRVTASFGLAVLKKKMSVDDLIDAADKALYEAKETGRNKVVLAK